MAMDVVLIGTGGIANEHARAIKKVNGLRLAGVFSSDKHRAGEFAKRYGIKDYTDLDDILKNPGVKILDIVNQNYLHGDFALQGIKAGKNVIIEKPIDIDVAKARRIVEESKKRGVAVTVISQYRFGGGFRKVKGMAESGGLGKLIMGVVVIGKHRNRGDYESGEGWKKSWKTAGGGVLMLNAVHYVNILRWIFGEVKSAKSELATLTHDIEVEDTGGIVMKFNSGGVATITATTSLKFNIPDRVEIYGSKKSVILENGRIVKKFYCNRVYAMLVSRLSWLSFTRQGCIREQIENFARFLESREKLGVSAEDGLKDLEVLGKVYK
ncbi:MAG TPA: Gfo/Idh/MocA family oxidoreductase [Candidatus Nanoarchaeia archaeon]|nr:Gfo/Idh/MocA family oxidoreductase [Candidatus Nanoarchaeia archaeon]